MSQTFGKKQRGGSGFAEDSAEEERDEVHGQR